MKANNTLVKSPLNYIGGKYKLLPQIIPLLPHKVNKFIDLFAGGLNVGINQNSNIIYCNDINNYVIDILQTLYEEKDTDIVEYIHNQIKKYKLSKTNQQGFESFRYFYNNSERKPLDLYTLICYSFNYQFRFNNKGDYNNAFGRNRSSFSETLEKKLRYFVEAIQNRNIVFSKKEFEVFDFTNFNSDDLVYCDPPYLITTGSYNDGKRGFKNWDINQEQKLLNILDYLNSRNIKFALSNVLEHKGKENELLIEWAKKYNTNYLNFNYKTSSYNGKNVDKVSIEVLITNY